VYKKYGHTSYIENRFCKPLMNMQISFEKVEFKLLGSGIYFLAGCTGQLVALV